MFPQEIETERLRLRRLCRENVPVRELYRYMRADAPGMAAVSEYVMWDPHETPKDTHEYLRDVEEQWDDRKQATYAIYRREDAERDDRADGTADPDTHAEEFVGTTNLHFDWERRSAELGIWIRKPFWGRGYSGERARALLELVGASHQAGNENSRRAIEKYVRRFGGQYDGLLRNFVPTDDGVRDLHRYTISQQQYRDATEERGTERENS